MKKTTAQALDELFNFLGDERWDLGDIILDVAQGGMIYNAKTSVLLRELFDSMPEPDSLTLHDIAHHINEVGNPYSNAVAREIWDWADDPNAKPKPHTVLCTGCSKNPAPAPKSIEVDPLCDNCLEKMSCPGWNDSCGNLKTPGGDLCPDCTTGRLDSQSPRIPN